MSTQAFAGLIGNASILLMLGLLYDFIYEKTFRWKRIAPFVTGVIIGFIGIILMTAPWRMSQDVIFDTRSILLSTAGLFFGSIATLIAVLMTSLYRLYIGGAGYLAGILTITTSAVIGLVWRWFSKKRFSEISLKELYLFGIVVHIDMFMCMLALPAQARANFFSEIAVPVIIIYPVASMLMGKMLLSQRERARDKKAIESEKEMLFVTLNSIDDAVIAADISGKITVINRIAEKMAGYTEGKAVGRLLTDVINIVDEKENPLLKGCFEKVIKNGRAVNLAGRPFLVSIDGTRYAVECVVSPIKDDALTTGAVLVFRDMTERNILSEKLRNTEKLESLGIMAGGIAHDFNNLLSGIYGNIEIAMIKNDPAEIKTHLQSAVNVFARAKDLTRQLITFSKGGTPDLSADDIRPVIRDSALFAMSGSNSKCEIDLPEDLWNAKFDKNQISDVIHNLVLNAVQAMPAGGTVRITGHNEMAEKYPVLKIAPGRYVKISVTDSGAGILKEDMNRIFDPFFTTKKTGSGLGLPTCFSVMKRHNGAIDIESEHGKGSTFSIFIPAAKEKEKSVKEKVTPSYAVIGAGRKVLIMDDEHFVRDILGTILVESGFSVSLVKEGAEAIQMIRKFKKGSGYFACFLDLTVPGGMGGLEAAKIIKDYDPGIHLFAFSGYSEDEVMTDPLKFGFSGSIRKPFKISELKDFLSIYIKN